MKFNVGDKVIVRGCQDDASRVGDVGEVIEAHAGDALVSFPSRSKNGTGYEQLGRPYCWWIDNDKLELVLLARPDWTLRDVNGVNIAEGDKIVYVTRRGSWMQMIPAVVVKASSVDITVRRTHTDCWQDPDRKIVLTHPAYIAITERAGATQEKA